MPCVGRMSEPHVQRWRDDYDGKGDGSDASRLHRQIGHSPLPDRISFASGGAIHLTVQASHLTTDCQVRQRRLAVMPRLRIQFTGIPPLRGRPCRRFACFVGLGIAFSHTWVVMAFRLMCSPRRVYMVFATGPAAGAPSTRKRQTPVRKSPRPALLSTESSRKGAAPSRRSADAR